MLVLRRKLGESILIGDSIEIQILDLNSQAVKVGIMAPKHVCILRKELYITQSENQSAARGVDLDTLAELFRK